MSSLLIVLGCFLCFGGGFWLLYVAFQESVLWAVGCVLIPFVSLIFTIMHWSEAKAPFLTHLAGVVLLVIGGLLRSPSPSPAG
jgi:hypothetical protein